MKFFLTLCLIATIVILNVAPGKATPGKASAKAPAKAPAKETPAKATAKATPAKTESPTKEHKAETAESSKAKDAKGIKRSPTAPTADPKAKITLPTRPRSPEPERIVVGFNFFEKREKPVFQFTNNTIKYRIELGTEADHFSDKEGAYVCYPPVIKVNDVEKTFEGCIVKMRDIKDTAGVAKMKNEQNVLMHFIDSAEFEHTTPKGTEKVQCAATMVLFDKLPEAKKEL